MGDLYKDDIGVIMLYIGDLIFRSSQGSGPHNSVNLSLQF